MTEKVDLKKYKDSGKNKISPVLGFIHEKRAYYTARLYGEDGRDDYVIVTDKKEIVKFDKQFFIENNVTPTHLRPVIGNNHWCKKAIEEYYNSKIKIDPENMIDALLTIIKKYLVFKNAEIDEITLALWIIATYCYPLFPNYPYLYFIGERETGKSTALQLISALAFNGHYMARATTSAIAHEIHNRSGTICCDELERLEDGCLNKDRELENLLLSAFEWGSKYIKSVRSKNDWEPKELSTYSPKALASINQIGDVLQSRTITFEMEFSPEVQKLDLVKFENEFSEARNMMFAWTLENWITVKEHLDNSEDVNLKGRRRDVYLPLFVIGKALGSFCGLDNFYGEILDTKVNYCKIEKPMDDNIILLEYVRDRISGNNDYFSNNKLMNEFASVSGIKFSSAKSFLNKLRRLGVIKETRRTNGTMRILFDLEKVCKQIELYGQKM
jgi:hypothetical protein